MGTKTTFAVDTTAEYISQVQFRYTDVVNQLMFTTNTGKIGSFEMNLSRMCCRPLERLVRYSD